MSSLSERQLLNEISPTCLKLKDTEPVSPKLPPFLVKIDLTSEAVLFLLSVNVSIIMAIPLFQILLSYF